MTCDAAALGIDLKASDGRHPCRRIACAHVERQRCVWGDDYAGRLWIQKGHDVRVIYRANATSQQVKGCDRKRSGCYAWFGREGRVCRDEK